MYKFVVLFAAVCAAVAEPGYIGAPIAYGASALTHQSRVDYHSSPVIAHAPLAYSAPLVHHYLKKRGLVAAPLAYSAVVAPGAVSHQSRVDVRSSVPVVAHAPLVHYLKKRGLAYSAVVAPGAVSHQSRVDVRSSPLIAHGPVAYAAPLVHHYLKKRALIASPLAYSAVAHPLAYHAPAIVAPHALAYAHHPAPFLTSHGVIAL